MFSNDRKLTLDLVRETQAVQGPTAQLAIGPSEFLEHETGLASACRFAAGALR
jgi:hypothetical protein